MATLGFSTKWPKNMGGGDTLFVPKIWKGLIDNDLAKWAGQHSEYETWADYSLSAEIIDSEYYKWFSGNTVFVREQNAKLHTMRKDPKGLWVPGRKIHMVVFNRTKNRFQFAPVLKVKSTQEVSIKYKGADKYPVVTIDNKRFTANDRYGVEMLREIAFNDGFNSMDHFFMWFNTNDTYKLIHWTDLKY